MSACLHRDRKIVSFGHNMSSFWGNGGLLPFGNRFFGRL
jgi:hypothetical protein